MLDDGAALTFDRAIGEAIDRLICVEMRFSSGLPRGVIHRLYDAARAWQEEPLTTRAAEALARRIRPGDRVLVVTGAGAPPWLPFGETDGPLGAAAIARGLDIGLGAKPVLVSEERNLPAIVAATEGIGLAVLPMAWFEERSACATTDALLLGEEAGPASARAILARHKPTAVVFVEKGGPNAKGVFHTITGRGRSADVMASAHVLAEEARAAGILTIGIGDGGNEIGFGAVAEAVRDIQPFGRRCACPCGEGIATVVETDSLVVAAISNWGAYGVMAALACALGDRHILHDAAAERRMLLRCVEKGAVDGILGRLEPGVDGTTPESQEAMLTLLGNLVDNALRAGQRSF
ncbi:glutamate cyclase domain-containing protein [Humitalea sp. 24SJ18S-53]|uniref:glutamate cyclase domain-containing protein n=1 Tax=Humitalea sp. 24SJ18S-53 TaxID=3422307 RepID=UPI003D6671E3